ncbi:MAG: transposase [Cyanobacteria bacterium J06621_11]
MTVKEREVQILRVKSTNIQPELESALEKRLRTVVVSAVKTTLEAALEEELSADLARMTPDQPRRSGHFSRSLDTQYGHVPDLQIPKLRRRNRERQWQILQRYQRGLGNLLDWLCCLYVMGLSLRDLQEALYFLIGHVLSRSAVNQVTLKVQHTNHIERLFREFRTKSDEIGAFPHEASCLTVFFLVVQRDNAKHDRKNMAKNS